MLCTCFIIGMEWLVDILDTSLPTYVKDMFANVNIDNIVVFIEETDFSVSFSIYYSRFMIDKYLPFCLHP